MDFITLLDQTYNSIHGENDKISYSESMELWQKTLEALFTLSNTNTILNLLLYVLKIESNLYIINKIVDIYNVLNMKSVVYDIFNESMESIDNFFKIVQNHQYQSRKDINEAILSLIDIQILNGKLSFVVIYHESIEKGRLLINLFINYIISDELLLSDLSSKILVNLIGIEYKVDNIVDFILKELIRSCDSYENDMIILLRFYILFLNILSINNDLFDLCYNIHICDRLVHLTKSNDILSLMVMMEHYILFSNTRNGRKYVITSGLLNWLFTLCVNTNSPFYDNSLAIQAIGVFTTIYSKIFEEQSHDLLDTTLWNSIESMIPRFLTCVVELMDSRDVTNRIIGIKVTGQFTSSSEQGFRIVTSNQLAMESWSSLGYSSGTIEIQSVIYDSYALVLDKHLPNSSLHDALKTFYDSLGLYHPRQGVTTTDILLKACKQPMIEVKYPALTLLRSAAFYPWGIHSIFASEGFMEYIETIEYTKQGREMKYLLLQAILHNPKVSLLAEAVVNTLQSIERKGPNYVPSKPDVDVMDM